MTAPALAEEFRTLSIAEPDFTVIRYVDDGETVDTLAPESDPRRRDQFERLANLAAPLLGLDAANPLPAFVALLFDRTPHGRFARDLNGPKGDAARWSDHADGETHLVDAFGAAAAMLAGLDAPPVQAATVATSGAAAWLTDTALAEKHSVNRDALRKRLARWRRLHGTGWAANEAAASREPKYLYDAAAIAPVIAALKTSSDGQQRPAGKKR